MPRFSSPAALATALLSLLLILPAGWAQDATGKVVGTVKDATGAVIPNATVVVTNLETKVAKETISDKQGFYQVLRRDHRVQQGSGQAGERS
jgi:hypothetical protein